MPFCEKAFMKNMKRWPRNRTKSFVFLRSLTKFARVSRTSKQMVPCFFRRNWSWRIVVKWSILKSMQPFVNRKSSDKNQKQSELFYTTTIRVLRSNWWVIQHTTLIWQSFFFPLVKNNLYDPRFSSFAEVVNAFKKHIFEETIFTVTKMLFGLFKAHARGYW